jgi:hypothetical protein
MLDLDIPLNAGCLVPLDSKNFSSFHRYSRSFFVLVRIPSGSLLAPSRTAAVCGGNVLTSQRIVDVVLRAFHACAASQGCTNNLTFGAGGKDSEGRAVAGWGYYEVCSSTLYFPYAGADRLYRRLREVLGQVRIGMEHRESIHTLPTHVSATSSYLSDDTQYSCTHSVCARVLLGLVNSAGARALSGNWNSWSRCRCLFYPRCGARLISYLHRKM